MCELSFCMLTAKASTYEVLRQAGFAADLQTALCVTVHLLSGPISSSQHATFAQELTAKVASKVCSSFSISHFFHRSSPRVQSSQQSGLVLLQRILPFELVMLISRNQEDKYNVSWLATCLGNRMEFCNEPNQMQLTQKLLSTLHSRSTCVSWEVLFSEPKASWCLQW